MNLILYVAVAVFSFGLGTFTAAPVDSRSESVGITNMVLGGVIAILWYISLFNWNFGS